MAVSLNVSPRLRSPPVTCFQAEPSSQWVCAILQSSAGTGFSVLRLGCALRARETLCRGAERAPGISWVSDGAEGEFTSKCL